MSLKQSELITLAGYLIASTVTSACHLCCAACPDRHSHLIRRAYHVGNTDVIMAAISASVSRGDRLARIGLTSLLGHPNVGIRLRSLEALAVLGSTEAHSIFHL